MTVERQVKRYLRRMLFWRLVGDVLSLPGDVLQALQGFCRAVERGVFALELHYARRYHLLTGDDLSMVMGDANRYRGLRLTQEELGRVYGDNG